MTIYQTVKLLNQYHKNKLSSFEGNFIKNLWMQFESSHEPTDQELYEHYGMTKPREEFLYDIAKRFLITKQTKNG